jgi:hypothetical protein
MHMFRVGGQADQVKSGDRRQDAKEPWQSFQSCIDSGVSPMHTVSTMGKETVLEMFRTCLDFAITSPQP